MNLDVWRTRIGTSEIEQLQTIPGLAESARNLWNQSWAGEGWWRAGLATRRGRIPRESRCVQCISQRPWRARPVEIFLAGPPAKRNHRERIVEHNVPGCVVVLGPSLSLPCPRMNGVVITVSSKIRRCNLGGLAVAAASARGRAGVAAGEVLGCSRAPGVPAYTVPCTTCVGGDVPPPYTAPEPHLL